MIFHSLFDGRKHYISATICELFIGDISSLPGDSSNVTDQQTKTYELRRIEIHYVPDSRGTGVSWNNMALSTLAKWIANHDVYEDAAKIIELHSPTSAQAKIVIECYLREGAAP